MILDLKLAHIVASESFSPLTIRTWNAFQRKSCNFSMLDIMSSLKLSRLTTLLSLSLNLMLNAQHRFRIADVSSKLILRVIWKSRIRDL